jgi:type II secretory pathway component PulF
LADEYENLYMIRTKYITAMIYPSILILIIVLALVVIFKLILPGFMNIISSFPNASLPESTQILVYVNNVVQTS